MINGSLDIGEFLYLRCESEFYDSIGDARQYSDSNGYMVFERCTVANGTKGAGTWVVDTRLASLLNERVITKETTGFTNCENVIVTYNSTTRKVTVTGTFEAYYLGEKITALVSGWESSAHADVHGLYFLRYCETGFEFTTTPWTFDCLQIAFVNYNTDKFGIRETHGFMQWQNHKELHEVIGTYRTAGGSLSGIVLNSTTVAERRPDVSATTVEDEDLRSVINALSTKQYTQRYLDGATPTRLFNVDQSDIIPLNGNVPYYNQNVGGTWQQTPIPNNNYAKLFYVAVPVTNDTGSQSFRYMWVQPQIIGTLTEIQAITTNSYSYGDSALFISEFVFVGEVIINVSGNNWSIYSTALLSGTKLGQIASPTGNFLTTVTHDASLTGSGTSGDPLIVVGKTIDNETDFVEPIDETNDKLTIWDNSLLKWIRFSFTNLKNFIGTYFLRLDQTTPQPITQSPKINDLLAGQMCYVDSNKQLKPINVFWDNVNKRMGVGRSTPQSLIHISLETTATNGVLRPLIVETQTTGIPVVGIGVGIDFRSEHTSSGLIESIAAIDAIVTNNFRSGALSFRVSQGSSPFEAMRINYIGNVGIKTTTPKSALQVAGGIQCGDDTAAASADKVGTTRYRETANASYVEMCVRTGASSFQWQTIVTNTW